MQQFIVKFNWQTAFTVWISQKLGEISTTGGGTQTGGTGVVQKQPEPTISNILRQIPWRQYSGGILKLAHLYFSQPKGQSDNDNSKTSGGISKFIDLLPDNVKESFKKINWPEVIRKIRQLGPGQSSTPSQINPNSGTTEKPPNSGGVNWSTTSPPLSGPKVPKNSQNLREETIKPTNTYPPNKVNPQPPISPPTSKPPNLREPGSNDDFLPKEFKIFFPPKNGGESDNEQRVKNQQPITNNNQPPQTPGWFTTKKPLLPIENEISTQKLNPGNKQNVYEKPNVQLTPSPLIPRPNDKNQGLGGPPTYNPPRNPPNNSGGSSTKGQGTGQIAGQPGKNGGSVEIKTNNIPINPSQSMKDFITSVDWSSNFQQWMKQNMKQMQDIEKGAELAKGFDLGFGLNRKSLDFIGLWPQKNNTSENKYFRTSRVPILLVILIMQGISPGLYALVKIIRSLPLVIDNLAVTFNYTSATCKIFLFWYKREALKKALQDVVLDWSTPKSPWELSTMMKQAKWSRYCTITGYLLMFSCVFSYSIAGIFNQSLRFINNITDPGYESGRYMPLQSYYPYDVSITPYYEVTYVVQCCTIATCGIALAVPDNLFGALVFHATGQCEILTSEMSHLIDGLKESNDEGKNDDEIFKFRIREAVKKHMLLI
ncbi:hypothetical protein QAD02_001137, partial [Eretmocerus hayati]